MVNERCDGLSTSTSTWYSTYLLTIIVQSLRKSMNYRESRKDKKKCI